MWRDALSSQIGHFDIGLDVEAGDEPDCTPE